MNPRPTMDERMTVTTAPPERHVTKEYYFRNPKPCDVRESKTAEPAHFRNRVLRTIGPSSKRFIKCKVADMAVDINTVYTSAFEQNS